MFVPMKQEHPEHDVFSGLISLWTKLQTSAVSLPTTVLEQLNTGNAMNRCCLRTMQTSSQRSSMIMLKKPPNVKLSASYRHYPLHDSECCKRTSDSNVIWVRTFRRSRNSGRRCGHSQRNGRIQGPCLTFCLTSQRFGEDTKRSLIAPDP
jgi:hypothetical protein